MCDSNASAHTHPRSAREGNHERYVEGTRTRAHKWRAKPLGGYYQLDAMDVSVVRSTSPGGSVVFQASAIFLHETRLHALRDLMLVNQHSYVKLSR